MGRVAKYKKVKACDPFSKKNGGRIELESVGIWGLSDNGRKPKKRSLKAQAMHARKKKRRDYDDGFDVPPEGDDFDLSDLTGSLKKEKLPLEQEGLALGTNNEFIKTNAKVQVASIPNSVEEEKRMNKLLKLDKQLEKKKPSVAEEGRMEGESKKAFHKRVKAETRQLIKRERVERSNPEKRQKKKEFLNNKKKKKKGSNRASSYVDSTDDENEEKEEGGALITGERAVAARAAATEVMFGEQAERPPTFRQLPRGATRKAERKIKGSMSSEDVEAEQAEMEKMRRKVLAQYALVRKRRKGEFHL